MEEFFAVIGNKASSNDLKTVTKYEMTSDWESSTYGNVIISSLSECICVWEIAVNAGYTNNLGITSGKAIPNEPCFRRKNDYNYCYSSYLGQTMSQHNFKTYGEQFGKGDRIKIRLDLIRKELSFYKNERSQGVAYSQIPCGDKINYRLAISQRREDCSVTLIGFTKYEVSKEQKDPSESLEKALKMEQDKNKILTGTIDKLKNRIEELENDQKEKEMKIQQMEKQIEDLKLKSIDVSEYQTWQHDDIFLWIMSLDSGRYDQYKDKLRNNLKLQQLTGQDLKDIEGSDLIDLGINVFKDKKALLKSIKELVNRNNEGTAYM